MHKNALMLILSISIISCATTMPGKDVRTGSKNVSATIAINDMLSNERIQMHQVSIRNNTNDWIEFDGATIEASDNVSVLLGDKTSSWIEACTLEHQVKQHNISLLIGAIGVAGAAVAGGSRHQDTARVGAVVALGSITALGVRDFQNSKNKIEFQDAFPEKHIFRPFTIPPKKVIQRWIIVENPAEESFKLKAKSKMGEEIEMSFIGEVDLKSNPSNKTRTQQW